MSTSAEAFMRFAEGVVADYHLAREPVEWHPKLSRGTARVVSSLTEERVAHLLLKCLPSIEHIYVDQELRCDDVPVFKPDLVVVAGDSIRLMIDVKMDLGRLRDRLPALAGAARDRLLRTRGRLACLSARTNSGQRRRKMQVAISPTCECILLIISGRNITAEALHAALAESKTSGRGIVHSMVMWPALHPNDPKFARGEDAVAALAPLTGSRPDCFDQFIGLCGRLLAAEPAASLNSAGGCR